MISRDYAKAQIDRLPEVALEKVIEFISFQRYSLGLFEDETDYILSIPGMEEKLIAASNEPLSECVPLSEIWDDV